jgi:uncharacterized protein (TIGR03067 family)
MFVRTFPLSSLGSKKFWEAHMAEKASGQAGNLSGSWRAVYSELNGEMTAVSHFAGIVITFKGKQFDIEVNGVKEHAGTYNIDTKSDPARITYVYEQSTFYELGKPRVGIFQVTKNTFKDCLGAVGAVPPKSFNTTHASNVVMTIHQRIGSEKGTGLPVSQNREVSQW